MLINLNTPQQMVRKTVIGLIFVVVKLIMLCNLLKLHNMGSLEETSGLSSSCLLVSVRVGEAVIERVSIC